MSRFPRVTLGPFVAASPAADGVALRFEHGSVFFDLPTPGALRLRIAAAGDEERRRSWAGVPAGAAPLTLASEGGVTIASGGDFEVSFDAASYRLVVTHDGDPLLDADAALIQFRDRGVALTSRLAASARVFGLGEKSGPMNRRGRVFSMWNTDAFAYEPRQDPLYKTIPFGLVVDGGRAHGLLLDHPGRTTFDVGVRDPESLEVSVPDGPLELTLLAGPSPAAVLDHYTALTGRPTRVPRWTLGYQQCRYSYFPEPRVRGLAKSFRDQRFPCDVLYLDIHYMERYRSFTWDEHRFPDLRGMIASLQDDGFRVIVIIDPGLVPDDAYAPYATGKAADVFLKTPEGEEWHGKVWPGLCAFPDFLRDDVRAWWGLLYASLLDVGIDGFWNDMNEPAILDAPTKTVPLDLVHELEEGPTPHGDVHNVYGAEMARATYEGITALRPDRRPVVMTRAAYAGTQEHATAWSGDNRSCWEDLRQSVSMVVSMGLSGFPIYGPDLGGFAGTPEPELVTRWLQVGAFFGVMRMHTFVDGPDQEPWSYGEPFTSWNREAIELRYRLLPTWYSLAHAASDDGTPPLRPGWFSWPEHCEDLDRDDQFLLGDALLVAPATRAGQHFRDVRLPPGFWMDLEEGTVFRGGYDVVVPCPSERIPLLLRAGFALFRQPLVQSTAEAPDVVEIDVLVGAAGESLLIEDEGDGPASGEGARRRTRVTTSWDGEAAEVTIREVEALALAFGNTLRLRLHGFAEAPTAHGLAGITTAFEDDVVTCKLARSALPVTLTLAGSLKPPAHDALAVAGDAELVLSEDRHVREQDGWTSRPLPTTVGFRRTDETLVVEIATALPETYAACDSVMEDGVALSFTPPTAAPLEVHVPFEAADPEGDRPDGVRWSVATDAGSLVATVTIPAALLGLDDPDVGIAMPASVAIKLSDRTGWRSHLAWPSPRWDDDDPANLVLTASR